MRESKPLPLGHIDQLEGVYICLVCVCVSCNEVQVKVNGLTMSRCFRYVMVVSVGTVHIRWVVWCTLILSLLDG
ncbi:hypothetical protein MPTK1_6g08970 [Marchantia polymorpha subsp. ruderalis]|uniref:Uncharacterized protein n=2 Tax=Marchantia polymorpha TaxID=3197 RepID=A0AAF6BQ31_MARPO|nr:hypothetical protein MARPO_0060s0022 [Marchantia polymorpha]BBN14115.1 hypothetical protein Mp_6g08970 [Marchantia polymorpha subsp. ruderalis]|eukprot:PTQ36928.1 hypothetical protein MARPO_0060s0022 [Marchantia polymorpha]